MLGKPIFDGGNLVSNTALTAPDSVAGFSSSSANILWLMGPTSAGKTTLANALVTYIRENDTKPIIHWDGDQVRDMLGPDLGFSPASRLKVVRILTEVSKATADAGIFTIVSALTAHEDARQLVFERLPQVLIGYVHCPIDTCIERDPKGLYRRAIDGEIDTLVGYNSDYIPPTSPDITIDTSSMGIPSCVEAIVSALNTRSQTGE